jgi:hypothetical protein
LRDRPTPVLSVSVALLDRDEALDQPKEALNSDVGIWKKRLKLGTCQHAGGV